MSQTVPTEPGWWWAEVDGERQIVEVWAEPDDVVPHLTARFLGDDWAVSRDGWTAADSDETRYGPDDAPRRLRWLAPVATVEEVERLRAVVTELAEHIEYDGDEKLSVTLADLLNVSPSRVPSSLRTLGGAK